MDQVLKSLIERKIVNGEAAMATPVKKGAVDRSALPFRRIVTGSALGDTGTTTAAAMPFLSGIDRTQLLIVGAVAAAVVVLIIIRAFK